LDTADLHMHSVCSDGEWSPSRLVKEARREGLRAIALTDHDTTAGLEEAFAAGDENGVEVIAGVEISTWLDADVHVLAYGFDPRFPALASLFHDAVDARRVRAERIVERLAELGKPISMAAVMTEAGEGAIGRPHVARALAKSGQVGSVREAFDRFLGDGKPACVEKMRVTPEEAARAVRAAGGVTVAAHPGCYGGTALVGRLAEAGIDGVEVNHHLHDRELTATLEAWADERGLLKTGGSDFHVPGAYTVGAVRVPYEWVERLKERVAERRAAAAAGGGD
jgi:hypothetical protein